MFYQKEVLPNGVRILTQQVSHVRSVAMRIWVDVGSRDESDETGRNFTQYRTYESVN